MSTTYYVRTYNCSFPTKAANCTSRNQVLNFTTVTEGTLLVTDNLLSNFTPFNIVNPIFFLHDNGATARNPIKGSYGEQRYSKLGDRGNYGLWQSVLSTSNYIGLEKTYWNTWGGFTSGTLATFKTELCTQFENVKNSLGYKGNWGTDNSQINMILFSCTFDDDAGKIYYFPLFYMGNDPQADETIVI